MSETASEPQADGPAPAKEDNTEAGASDPTLHELAVKVDRIMDWLEGQEGQRQAAADPTGMKREMKQALSEFESAKEARAAREEHARSLEDRIGELEHKAEDKPMEFKRATNMMGWAKP